MFNRSIIMGRLCNEPVIKTTPSGKSFATFRVAVERAYAPKDGERETDFFNIRAWGGRAEFVCKYFQHDYARGRTAAAPIYQPEW